MIHKESIVGAVDNDQLRAASLTVVTSTHTPLLVKLQNAMEDIKERVGAKRERFEAARQLLSAKKEQLLAPYRGQLAFVPQDLNRSPFADAPNSTVLSSAPAGFVPVIIYGLPLEESPSLSSSLVDPITEINRVTSQSSS